MANFHEEKLAKERETYDVALRLAYALDELGIGSPGVLCLLWEYRRKAGADSPETLRKAHAQLLKPDSRLHDRQSSNPFRYQAEATQIANDFKTAYGHPIDSTSIGDEARKTSDDRIGSIRKLHESGILLEGMAYPNKIPRDFYQSACRQGDTLLLLSLSPKTHTDWQLDKFDLKTSTIQKIGTVANLDYKDFVSWLPEMTVSGGSAWIPCAKGIMRFQLDGSSASIFQPPLPSLATTSALVVGDWLYIAAVTLPNVDKSHAISAGWLCRCKLDGTGMHVLAASERLEERSGLDHTTPWSAHGLTYDEAGRRIIAAVRLKNGKTRLWQIDLATLAINPLSDPFGARGEVEVLTQDDHINKRLFISSGDDLLSYDYTAQGQLSTYYIPTSYMKSARQATYRGGFEFHLALPFVELPGKALIISDGGADWALLDPGVDNSSNQLLPPLDNRSPIFLDTWDGDVVAVTQTDVWRITFATLPQPVPSMKRQDSASVATHVAVCREEKHQSKSTSVSIAYEKQAVAVSNGSQTLVVRFKGGAPKPHKDAKDDIRKSAVVEYDYRLHDITTLLEEHGAGTLFEKYKVEKTPDGKTRMTDNGSSLGIKAGQFELKWSQCDKNKGWLYYDKNRFTLSIIDKTDFGTYSPPPRLDGQ